MLTFYRSKRKLVNDLLVLLSCLASPLAARAAPVLYFSDLTAGPATGLGDGLGSGAIVTIWGVNLGSSQGTSTVKVGNVQATQIYEWANATKHTGHPADLYSYHKMQTIAFSVPASAATGATTISVTVGGATSNTIPFYVNTGNIIHIKSKGTDGASCGSWATPCLTAQYVVDNRMNPGDTAYIGSGVDPYSASQESILIGFGSAKNGTATNPYQVTAYPGASVTLTSGAGHGIGNYSLQNSYWTFSKLTVNVNETVMDTLQQLRFIANEAAGTGACITGGEAGILGTGGSIYFPAQFSSGMRFYGNYVHGFGCNNSTQTKMFHTFYISNRTGVQANDGEYLGWNVLTNNSTNYGLHIYDESYCGGWAKPIYVHDNVVMNQNGSAIDWNMSCDAGRVVNTSVYYYNNLLINDGLGFNYFDGSTGGCSFCLNGGNGAFTGTLYLYNNTFYGWGADSFSGSSGAFQLITFGGTPWNGHLVIQNNIVVDTNGHPFYTKSSPLVIPDVSSNNLWFSTAGPSSPPSWDTNPLNSDPKFNNPPGNNLSLTFTSPAKDTGIAIGQVSMDILGLSRPQGPAYDLGAYEYVSGGNTLTSPPARPTGFRLQ